MQDEVGAGECIGEYLRARYPGLYQILTLVIRIDHGSSLEEIVRSDRSKLLLALRKLYGDEVAKLIFKSIEEACIKEKK